MWDITYRMWRWRIGNKNKTQEKNIRSGCRSTAPFSNALRSLQIKHFSKTFIKWLREHNQVSKMKLKRMTSVMVRAHKNVSKVLLYEVL